MAVQQCKGWMVGKQRGEEKQIVMAETRIVFYVNVKYRMPIRMQINS